MSKPSHRASSRNRPQCPPRATSWPTFLTAIRENWLTFAGSIIVPIMLYLVATFHSDLRCINVSRERWTSRDSRPTPFISMQADYLFANRGLKSGGISEIKAFPVSAFPMPTVDSIIFTRTRIPWRGAAKIAVETLLQLPMDPGNRLLRYRLVFYDDQGLEVYSTDYAVSMDDISDSDTPPQLPGAGYLFHEESLDAEGRTRFRAEIPADDR